MKKLMVLALGCMFTANVFAQEMDYGKGQKGTQVPDQKAKVEKYCAKYQGGKLTLMKNDEVVTADVALKNGDILSADCSILKSDGTKAKLGEGECVDETGKMDKKAGDL